MKAPSERTMYIMDGMALSVVFLNAMLQMAFSNYWASAAWFTCILFLASSMSYRDLVDRSQKLCTRLLDDLDTAYKVIEKLKEQKS